MDPESAHSKYYQSGLQSFESISKTECLILLGEAGIGKSKVLDESFRSVSAECTVTKDTPLFFDLRDHGTDAGIKAEIFQSPKVLKWQADQTSVLHLFLDSFDEGLLEISNLSSILMSNLKQLPVDRLRLRLACRPSDWPASFEKSLGQLWGETKVGVWQLAPLTRNNVRIAAENHGVSANAFIAALLKSETVPLAIKPVTLDFLLGEFLSGDPLTSNRYALYLNGCTRLCDEVNPGRADSPRGRGRRTAQERLAIAARFGAIMQLAQKSGIWKGPDTKCPPQFLSIGQLVELGESSYAKDDVMEVLNKGPFMARAANIVDWRHHSYAEFLAAHYLQIKPRPGNLWAILDRMNGPMCAAALIDNGLRDGAGLRSPVFFP